MRPNQRLAFIAVLAVVLAACGAPGPAPTTTPNPQVHVCGPLDALTCADAVGAVTRQVPGTAHASVAVVAPRDPDALLRRGGDLVVLVAFSPDGFVGEDVWFNPPTWVVTLGPLGPGPTVEPWRETQLPPAFVTLLRRSRFAV